MKALANLVAVAALAAVVAFWGWRWLGPSPEPIVRKPVDDVAAALGVSPPFGASQTPAAGVPAVSPTPAAGEVRVLGVLAEADGRGRALLRFPDGCARLAAAGEALGAAGTLVAVHPDGVTLRGASGERRIPLRQPAAVQPVATAASCAPAGFTAVHQRGVSGVRGGLVVGGLHRREASGPELKRD